MGVYGISGLDSTGILEPGVSRFAFGVDIVSNFTSAQTATERIRIDGETYRAKFRYTRGIRESWHAGVEIPVVAHDGGFLDGFISEWHSFWGLPNLGRPEVDNNQLIYSYQRNGNDLVSISSATSGLGDITVFAGKSIKQDVTHAAVQLKLPTGDSNKLHGSGGVDLSTWLHTHRRLSANWRGGGRIGIAYLGSNDVLPAETQRHWAAMGSFYLAWRPHPVIAFKAQFDANSPLYKNSDIDQLTESSVQLSAGGSLRIGAKTYFDFAVTEDELNPDVSSDVGFHIRLRHLP